MLGLDAAGSCCVADDDTGFLTDGGQCCESAGLMDGCGVCRGDGRSCARLIHGALITFEGGDGGAVLELLQRALPASNLSLESFHAHRELAQEPFPETTSIPEYPDLHTEVGHSTTTGAVEPEDRATVKRGLRNTGVGGDEGGAAVTVSVSYRLAPGSAVLYASKDLAAAFVNATAVAAERGLLVGASPLPSVSVQVRACVVHICCFVILLNRNTSAFLRPCLWSSWYTSTKLVLVFGSSEHRRKNFYKVQLASG